MGDLRGLRLAHGRKPGTIHPMPNQLVILPCTDSDTQAALRHRELTIDLNLACSLGRSAVQFSRAGIYQTARGQVISLAADVATARANKLSISPYP